jgi:hypothetical protein
MDPSHIPFAHHGLQGHRSDGIPIQISNIKKEEPGYSFEFQDKTMKMKRKGIASFDGTYMVSYVSKFINNKKEFNLTMFCIPCDIGKSRIILLSTQTHDRKTLFQKFREIIPEWIIHIFSSRFLDSYLIFLHYQDINYRKTNKSYYMPAECDKSITMIKKS